MWAVLFLSLILFSFQMIILPSSDVEKRGWDSAHPAFSCKEILDNRPIVTCQDMVVSE